MRLPIKKLPLKNWLMIFGIWTLAALSLTTQSYLNSRENAPEISWLLMLLKQLPAWYLCALLTPVIMFFYEKYPLDTDRWRLNVLMQVMTALVILIVFSHFRLAAVNIIVDKSFAEYTPESYLMAYLSQLFWDFSIYVFIVIAIFAEKNYFGRKEKELYSLKLDHQNKELQNQLSKAQLEALKLQLSPHFLFNTLNTINGLIRSQDYSTAIKVNTKLGDFLRKTLYDEASQFVFLQKEIEFLDLYLSIEKLRFNDRLDIEKAIPRETLQMKVPYFILQPIIENAIKHGIARKGEARLISIHSMLENGYLVIKIFNEGHPLPDNWVLEDNWGIGLSNVVSRLDKIYQGNYKFTIQNDVGKNGVEVELKLPSVTPVFI